ncbi:MAG: hypothetical protein AABP62_02285 [Planctomycetota bacterium]
MLKFTQFVVAVFAFAGLSGVAIHAQDDAKSESAVPAKPSREELRDKQLDVSLEARDIERILTKLKRASELSKTRITEAAKTAESASTALDRGDSKVARGDAKQAAEMFREIAKLLEALLAEETPQKIAAARNLANQLAMTERQFAKDFKGVMNPVQSGGKAKVDPKSQVKPGKNGQGQGGGGQGGMPKKSDSATENEPKDGNGSKPEKNKDGEAGDKKEGDAKGGGSQKDSKEADSKEVDGDKTGAGDGKSDSKDDPKGGSGQGAREEDKDGKEQPDGQGGGAAKKDEKSKNGTGGDSAKDEKDRDKKDGQDGSGGAMTAEERREALATRAEQLARTGKSLEDILKSISQSTEPADKAAVAKIEAVLKETDLLKAIEAMQQAADMIRSDKLDDVRLSSLDIADRMEITAQRLDAAYRTIVAPQAEELRKLEQALADLREKLDALETQGQIAAWHREARDLLDRAEKLGISDKVREDFLEQMKKAGLGVNGARNAFNWGLVNDRYAAPDGYAINLIRVQEEVQARIQSLVLGDFTSATDENTPPKYQELVERYYQVLSREGGGRKPEMRNPKPETKPNVRTPKIKSP